MNKGNWIPVDKNIVLLSPYAKEGQYSEQSAYISLRIDLDNNTVKGLREYGRIWNWPRSKVSNLFKKIGYKTKDTLETLSRQNQDTLETPISLIYNTLSDSEKTKPRQNQDTLETLSGHNYKTKTKEEDKDKENKKKYTKKNFVPPTLEEVRNYFKEKGYSVYAADKAFEYYSIANWHDSKGNKVKNWKQKMMVVWFKDENKVSIQENIFSRS